jgi:hypothetical protein
MKWHQLAGAGGVNNINGVAMVAAWQRKHQWHRNKYERKLK